MRGFNIAIVIEPVHGSSASHQTAKIPLKCFGAGRALLTCSRSPFQLATDSHSAVPYRLRPPDRKTAAAMMGSRVPASASYRQPQCRTLPIVTVFWSWGAKYYGIQPIKCKRLGTFFGGAVQRLEGLKASETALSTSAPSADLDFTYSSLVSAAHVKGLILGDAQQEAKRASGSPFPDHLAVNDGPVTEFISLNLDAGLIQDFKPLKSSFKLETAVFDGRPVLIEWKILPSQ